MRLSIKANEPSKAYQTATEVFNLTAEKMAASRDTDQKFRAFIEGMQRLRSQFQESKIEVNLDLVDELADFVSGISTTSKALFEEDPASSFEESLNLAESLDGVSQVLVDIANSIQKPCSFDNSISESSLSALNKAMDNSREIAKEAALGFFSTAETIFSAVGAESSEETIAIEFGTRGTPCSCHSYKVSGTPDDTSNEQTPIVAIADSFEIDDKGIRLGLSELDELVAMLEKVLLALAALFGVLPAVSLCSSQCTPGNYKVTVASVGVAKCSRKNGKGKQTNGYCGTFSLNYKVCCQNYCMMFWTDEFYVDLGNTNHTLVRMTPGRTPRSKKNINGHRQTGRLGSRKSDDIRRSFPPDKGKANLRDAFSSYKLLTVRGKIISLQNLETLSFRESSFHRVLV